METDQSLSQQTDSVVLSETNDGEQPTPRSGARVWRRWLLLLGAAVLVIATVGWFGVLSPLRNPAAIPIPGKLADLPLTGHAFGREAAEHIAHLHRNQFPMTGAAVGEYGNGQATVWVSTAWGRWGAQRQIRAMTDAIAEGTSSFETTGVQNVEGCTVYSLTGMGQAHFYFRAGDRIVWLAVTPDRAAVALRSLAGYYAPDAATSSRCQ